MKQQNACSKEEFGELKAKSYRNISRLLLRTIIKELPDYACVVYLALYDLSEINQRHPGTVIISHAALASEIDKSEASVKRAIKTLNTMGYIKIIQQGERFRCYKPNIIHVVCPQAVLEKIKNEESDRKPKLLSFPKVTKPEAEKMTPEATKIDRLHEAYQGEFKRLCHLGVSPLIASKEAFKLFSEAEALIIQKVILDNQSPSEIGLAGSNLIPGECKNDQHMNTNNRTDLSLLTIEARMSDDRNQTLKRQGVEFKPIVAFKSEIVKILSIEEREMINKKLKAMQRSQEIAPSLLASGVTFQNLIDEVVHHVQYRDLSKVSTVKHALNACAKMLRNGTWTTPKRFIWHQINRRERQAQLQKEQEIKASKLFFKEGLTGAIVI